MAVEIPSDARCRKESSIATFAMLFLLLLTFLALMWGPVLLFAFNLQKVPEDSKVPLACAAVPWIPFTGTLLSRAFTPRSFLWRFLTWFSTRSWKKDANRT